MKDKTTLFEYLYENLKEQIVSGRIKCGESLPSMNSVSEQYNIGIRTVKDVFRALSSEGYIKTEERKAAVVIYSDNKDSQESAVKYVLERKSFIVEVYQTMALLMPELFCFSSQVCGQKYLDLWEKSLSRSKKKDTQSRWSVASDFLYDILEKSNNLLFRDLFFSLDVYARLPLFSSHDGFIELVDTKSIGNSMWVMESLLTGNRSEIIYRFGLMYDAVINAIQKYLDIMAEKNPNVEEGEYDYSWAAERGREHYYTQIARELIDKIGSGIYKPDTFLPHEAELSEQYGVSVSTVRKAILMLNELGVAKTFNAKGTKAMLQNKEMAMKSIKNKKYKRDTLMYLSALQLMTITVKAAAESAFQNIDKDVINELDEKMSCHDSINLDCIQECINKYVSLRPLKTILEETGEIIYGGYYYAFYRDGSQAANLLNFKSQKAFECLKHGDKKGFAAKTSECYGHILKIVRDYLIGYGLTEAKNFVVPE